MYRDIKLPIYSIEKVFNKIRGVFMFSKIRQYFDGLKYVEAIKAQYYSKGQEEASARFIVQQKNMTKTIEELSAQNTMIERKLRQAADERIDKMEQLHNAKCNSCRRNLEDERQRLLKRQNQLAKKISEFEEVWLTMYQHANTIIDEHDLLLRSCGRLVASRNILIDFKKRVDLIMEESAPLLSMELQDSSEDKNIDTVLPSDKTIITDSLILPGETIQTKYDTEKIKSIKQ